MKIKLFVILIIQFLLIGIMSPSYAQSGYTQITSNEATILLDNERIIKYVKSGLLDCWIKKLITEQDKSLKNKTQAERNEAKLLKKAKTSYQLMHQQFDPVNFRYKVLEVYSYEAKSNKLRLSNTSAYWVGIPIDSIEEKTMMSVNDYILKNPDKIIMK